MTSLCPQKKASLQVSSEQLFGDVLCVHPHEVHSVLSGFAPLMGKNKFRLKLYLPEDTRQLTRAADLLIPITGIYGISCLPQNSQCFPCCTISVENIIIFRVKENHHFSSASRSAGHPQQMITSSVQRLPREMGRKLQRLLMSMVRLMTKISLHLCWAEDSNGGTPELVCYCWEWHKWVAQFSHLNSAQPHRSSVLSVIMLVLPMEPRQQPGHCKLITITFLKVSLNILKTKQKGKIFLDLRAKYCKITVSHTSDNQSLHWLSWGGGKLDYCSEESSAFLLPERKINHRTFHIPHRS